MNSDPDHSLWRVVTDLSLGVIGSILAVIVGLGVKGLRDMLRDIERSKIRIRELERRAGIEHDEDEP